MIEEYAQFGQPCGAAAPRTSERGLLPHRAVHHNAMIVILWHVKVVVVLRMRHPLLLPNTVQIVIIVMVIVMSIRGILAIVIVDLLVLILVLVPALPRQLRFAVIVAASVSCIVALHGARLPFFLFFPSLSGD